MSRRFSARRDHNRARELAALQLDEALAPVDAVWLETHVAVCDDCRLVAAAYVDGRSALRALRATAPEPPRDLWARTAARIEVDATRRPNLNPAPRGAFGGRVRRGAIAPLAAVLVVAVAVGAGLFSGTSLLPASTAALPTPIAITAVADVQVLSRSEDGSVQILSRPVNAVCPVGSSECGITRTFAVTNVGGVGSGSLNAAMSPHRDRLVVVATSNGTQGVYVLPFSISTPAPTSSDTPGASDGSTASLFSASPVAVATVVVVPGTPSVDTPPPVTTTSPSGTVDPSASPVSSPSIPVSPAPGGVLEIATNVVVVGPAAYSPDGTQVAFSARPADGSAGPDVYVWTTGDAIARALTTDHAAQFASWTTAGILVSRVVDTTPATTLVDPASGAEAPVAIGAAWLPVVDPTGTVGAWWSGTVKRDEAGDWVPDQGSLVIGQWPNGAGAGSVPPAVEPSPSAAGSAPSSAASSGDPVGSPPAAANASSSVAPTVALTAGPATPDATVTSAPAATPSAGGDVSPSPSSASERVQVLIHGSLTAWAVRWDETGSAMAVWTLGASEGATAGETPGTTAAGASGATSGDPASSPDASVAAPEKTPTNKDVAPPQTGAAQTVVPQPAGSQPAGSSAPMPTGRLSLYRVDPVTRLVDPVNPMLDAALADGGFSLRTGRLAWTARTGAGALVLQVLAWSGATIGRMELPAATGAMIVP